MKILVTNDDGINSEGLAIVVDFASKLDNAEIIVAAPMSQQSGRSQSIEIHQPFAVLEEKELFKQYPNVKAYAIGSTPTDCVRFILEKVCPTFDYILSGINKGLNIGYTIGYSGTVGAALEGGFNGIKSIAFSTPEESFENAKNNLPRIWSFIQENSLFDYTGVYNVNIPLSCSDDEIRVTRQGDIHFEDGYKLVGENLYEPQSWVAIECKGREDYDTEAIFYHKISITPLSVKKTDEIAYQGIMKKLSK